MRYHDGFKECINHLKGSNGDFIRCRCQLLRKDLLTKAKTARFSSTTDCIFFDNVEKILHSVRFDFSFDTYDERLGTESWGGRHIYFRINAERGIRRERRGKDRYAEGEDEGSDRFEIVHSAGVPYDRWVLIKWLLNSRSVPVASCSHQLRYLDMGAFWLTQQSGKDILGA